MPHANRPPKVYRKAYQAHLLSNTTSMKKRGIVAAIDDSLTQAGFGRTKGDLILRREIKRMFLAAALETKAAKQQELLYSTALEIIENIKGLQARYKFMEEWKKNTKLIIQAGEDFQRRQ